MAPIHRRALAEDSWEDLFDFLDAARRDKRAGDRDRDAEARLEEITRKLVYFFGSRGCGAAEDLATETIIRVAAKCRELSALPLNERTAYFYGVARNVLHEWLREERREWAGRESAGKDPTMLPETDMRSRDREELEHRCLDRCLARLAGGARRLILEYYAAEKSAKIVVHRELADRVGKSINALRIEVHRIRTALRRCVVECVHLQRAGIPSL